MTTARCFGGALDGTWRAIDGHRLLAPVMDYNYKAMTIEPDEPLRCGIRVHQYTLQKFVVGAGAVTRETLWGDYREPIYFHALIGPGFTVAMVKAWLDGWIEEAERMRREWKRNNLARHYGYKGESIMETVQGRTIRSHTTELERRLANQAEYITELREGKEEAEKLLRREKYATKMLEQGRRNARAERDEARGRLDRALAREGLPAGWPSIMATNERLQQTVKRLTGELKDVRDANEKIRQDRDNWQEIARPWLGALLRD